MESKTTTISTIPLLGLLFTGLKLGGIIDWSWWWVTLPFWGGFALAGLIIGVFLLTALIGNFDK